MKCGRIRLLSISFKYFLTDIPRGGRGTGGYETLSYSMKLLVVVWSFCETYLVRHFSSTYAAQPPPLSRVNIIPNDNYTFFVTHWQFSTTIFASAWKSDTYSK